MGDLCCCLGRFGGNPAAVFFQMDSDILLWDPALVALWLHHLDSFGQTVTNQTALEFSLFA